MLFREATTVVIPGTPPTPFIPAQMTCPGVVLPPGSATTPAPSPPPPGGPGAAPPDPPVFVCDLVCVTWADGPDPHGSAASGQDVSRHCVEYRLVCP